MILSRLREVTGPDHQRLEARIDLLGRQWSPAFYQQLLQKFYGFYAVLEPALLRHPHWEQQNIHVEERRKLGLLHQDLNCLGVSNSEVEALPHCQRAPSPKNFAQALGCAYVLEGSTLGGQVITRHLHRTLGIEPECGGAYFHSYGTNVGPMWREFVAVLEAYPLCPEEQDELLTSACQTFNTLEAWLSDIL